MAGQPTHSVVTNSKFIGNKMYQISLVEMEIYSSSIVDVMHSNFYNNTGSALIYFELLSTSLNISLYDVKAIENYGTSVARRNGLFVFQIFEEDCIVNITELNFANNHFERDGGGIYINGIVRRSLKFYVKDSNFQNNIGHSSGTVLYAELRTDIAFLFSIYNSSFIGNSGGTSIVRIVNRSDMNVLIRKLAILLLGNSTVFANNLGGALSMDDTLLVGVGNTTFHSNTVNNGAGLFLGDSFVLLNISHFSFNFHHNFAFRRGGAMYIEFPSNLNATKCNWLLYENSDEICNATLLIMISEVCCVNSQVLLLKIYKYMHNLM